MLNPWIQLRVPLRGDHRDTTTNGATLLKAGMRVNCSIKCRAPKAGGGSRLFPQARPVLGLAAQDLGVETLLNSRAVAICQGSSQMLYRDTLKLAMSVLPPTCSCFSSSSCTRAHPEWYSRLDQSTRTSTLCLDTKQSYPGSARVRSVYLPMHCLALTHC